MGNSYAFNPLDTSTGRGVGGNIVNPFGFGQGPAPLQGFNPVIPTYQPGYNPLSMSLTPGLSSQLNGIQMDKSGLEAFRQQALRKGPSAWANLAVADQAAQAANARDTGAKAVHGQEAQAEDALASRGGLSSGARERNVQEGAKNYLGMSQDLTRQQNLNTMQIGMNDEQNRIQQLSQLPGMEYQAIQPDLQKSGMWETARAQDLQNQLEETNRQNQAAQLAAQQQNQSNASQQQAQATQNAGKKGPF